MDQQFIKRKEEHLHYALKPESQTTHLSLFDQLELTHDSLPDLNFSDISITTSFLDSEIATPFYVCGMTAGHEQANLVNERIALLCSSRGWVMGVGSQRREIDSDYEDQSLFAIRLKYPNLKLISNLGIAQLIELYHRNDFSKLQKLIEKTQSVMIAIHLNPLQEAIQTEGTPQFKGGLKAIEAWQKISPVPVVIKETGSGMSETTLLKLKGLGLFAVDVSGTGGTHWGRMEGLRASEQSATSQFGKIFANWGTATLNSLLAAESIFTGEPTELWASGGIRSGLDAAKAIALGAARVGFAQPVLKAALLGEKEILEWAMRVEQELKIAMFCTGAESITELNREKLQGFSS